MAKVREYKIVSTEYLQNSEEFLNNLAKLGYRIIASYCGYDAPSHTHFYVFIMERKLKAPKVRDAV